LALTIGADDMTNNDTKVTGGCLCGAVRYCAGERLSGGMICHCRMCQQASGTAFSLNAIYVRDAVQITLGEPTWFASSEIAERGFCAKCGSPLFVRYSVPEWRGWIAVAIGSHDEPEKIAPERHFGTESRLSWLETDDGLPQSDYPDTFLEQVSVGGNLAYQSLPQRD
jgi:hypothetical protein